MRTLTFVLIALVLASPSLAADLRKLNCKATVPCQHSTTDALGYCIKSVTLKELAEGQGQMVIARTKADGSSMPKLQIGGPLRFISTEVDKSANFYGLTEMSTGVSVEGNYTLDLISSDGKVYGGSIFIRQDFETPLKCKLSPL